MSPALALDDITCTFVSRDDRNQRYTAVRDVKLDIAQGEFVSVVGPTGCGKSTLLNVAAGLLQPSTGSAQSPTNLQDSTIFCLRPLKISGSTCREGQKLAVIQFLQREISSNPLMEPTGFCIGRDVIE